MRWVLLAAALILAACQPAQVMEPEPTIEVLVVSVTPALRALTAQFQSCAAGLPNTGLVLVDSADAASAALALRWGTEPAPEGYAAVIGQEDLVVVVNPENSLERISLADLRAIYQGMLFTWEHSSDPIEAWAYPTGMDAQRVFERAVMSGAPVDRRAVGTLPDPQAVLQAVSSSPSAVGFLPKRWLNGSVKPVAIDGIQTDDLRAPLLALSDQEPGGAARSWLVCLQASLQ